MRMIGSGDEHAFAELYHRHSAEVYRYAYGMCGAKPVAEDCTQEVFLNVLQDSAGYRGSLGSVRSWLLGTARYKVIDRFRQLGRFDMGLDIDCLADSAQTAEQGFENRQRINDVRRAIAALPLRYREVIVLCELEELSYAEAATTIDCPVGTVRSRLHRGREMLATKLRSRANMVRGGQADAMKCGEIS